jgi:hypothetical protein
MPDLLDIKDTLTEDEEYEYDTFSHTKPGDDHDHALVYTESEIT